MLAMHAHKSIRVFDMFCGGAGSSRGAFMAGATPIAGLDMWNLAAETYQLNFPESHVYRMRASSLEPTRVIEDVGEIDLLLASPEGTSHSVAKGHRPRCEKSRATAFEVIRFAKVLRPRWIVVENVIQMRKWRRFDEWHDKLERIGYQTVVTVLDAQYHGTPQSRRRMIVVADREKPPELPSAKRRTSKTVAGILGRGQPKDSPWRFTPLEHSGRAAATVQRAHRAIKEVGKHTAFIMVYYGSDGAGGYQSLDRPLRTVTTLDRFAYVKPVEGGHVMRMLQPPELSAAMGFPCYHKWADSSRRDRIRLIGNAVCPPVMRDVVKALVSG